MVADLMVDGEWRIQFRRELDGNQVVKLGELVEKLQRVNLSAEEDMVRWAFEKNGCFSTSSLYIFFSSGRVHSRRIEEIWGTTLPLKIRFFFLWQVVHDKLQLAEQLKKHECKGDIECQLCGKLKNVDHILFRCVCSRFVWTVLKETFGWSIASTSR
jgi:hypothetical protein